MYVLGGYITQPLLYTVSDTFKVEYHLVSSDCLLLAFISVYMFVEWIWTNMCMYVGVCVMYSMCVSIGKVTQCVSRTLVPSLFCNRLIQHLGVSQPLMSCSSCRAQHAELKSLDV